MTLPSCAIVVMAASLASYELLLRVMPGSEPFLRCSTTTSAWNSTCLSAIWIPRFSLSSQDVPEASISALEGVSMASFDGTERGGRRVDASLN